jgi:hypothetical protein
VVIDARDLNKLQGLGYGSKVRNMGHGAGRPTTTLIRPNRVRLPRKHLVPVHRRCAVTYAPGLLRPGLGPDIYRCNVRLFNLDNHLSPEYYMDERPHLGLLYFRVIKRNKGMTNCESTLARLPAFCLRSRELKPTYGDIALI